VINTHKPTSAKPFLLTLIRALDNTALIFEGSQEEYVEVNLRT
jgi:hypothetical protein